MWDEILKKTKNLISATTYIKVAIIEKMISEDPENKEYYESLLFLK
jgi:hypothetical protein